MQWTQYTSIYRTLCKISLPTHRVAWLQSSIFGVSHVFQCRKQQSTADRSCGRFLQGLAQITPLGEHFMTYRPKVPQTQILPPRLPQTKNWGPILYLRSLVGRRSWTRGHGGLKVWPTQKFWRGAPYDL